MRLELLIAVLLSLLAASEGIRVVEVVVPAVVTAGQAVVLECRYEEEGDKLYTLKWWRGDDQFYQLVPPKRSYYHASGVSVNMSATEHLNPYGSKGLERVMLEPVSLDAAGVYKCEVMADQTFHTVSQQANMTVVYVPDGLPAMYGMEEALQVRSGQRVLLNCSTPPASPPPVITWLVNGKRAPTDWSVSYAPQLRGAGSPPVRVSSTLDFYIPPGLLGGDGLHVDCVARQTLSGYHQTTSVVLPQERLAFSWLFSSGRGSAALLPCAALLVACAVAAVLLRLDSAPVIAGAPAAKY
ncbi:uncharacterized protein LOC125178759 [Hyalella azteca]|uniref:Uncharacterized protein LOC125178759 n=1 Tax=Hyalella azteca TaxID=294128 RepID=A0A979FSV7_HYAAZ|nr:uncharacterized protein LOC125178759 [Hyalella azteca]